MSFIILRPEKCHPFIPTKKCLIKVQSRFFLNEIGVKQCFYVVMLRLCPCARRLLGAVRPGDAVQPSVRGLELDEQHRHQLCPPRRQRERRSAARGGRGRGGAQQSHQQLSQRTGLEWKRQSETISRVLEVWRAADETARVNPHRPLHRRYVIGESSSFCCALCWFSFVLQPGMLCDPWVRVQLWKAGYLFGPNALTINMRFNRMLGNHPPFFLFFFK